MSNPWRGSGRDINEGASIVWRVAGILAVALLAVMFVGILSGWFSFGLNWATEPAERYGPENVKQQYEQFYSMRRGLESAIANQRGTQDKMDDLKAVYGDDVSTWPVEQRMNYQSLTGALRQQQNGYNDLCGRYQAAWDNYFRATVAPPDLPRSCEYTQ